MHKLMPARACTENKRVERMIKSRPTAEQKKLRTLAHLFRPPFELLFNGTFEEAKREGARTRKWLLVNVQVVLSLSPATPPD